MVVWSVPTARDGAAGLDEDLGARCTGPNRLPSALQLAKLDGYYLS